MNWLDWVAAVVIFGQFGVPLYWLVLHPLVGFWRKHRRMAYVAAVLASWGIVGVLLSQFHARLFVGRLAPLWAIVLGFLLMVSELYLFIRAERDLGGRRLVGQAELEGRGELATRGIYARMRHPRYAGTMLSVLGACLVAGTLTLWLAAGVWLLLTLLVVWLEERELRARFGAAYLEYTRRVPRFLPFRFWPREE